MSRRSLLAAALWTTTTTTMSLQAEQPFPKKTYMITGSTDGIGKFTAQKVARDGHRVLVHGRSREKVEAVVATLRRSGGTAEGFVADLSSLAEVRSLGAAVLSYLEDAPLHGLLCNAGTFDGDYTGKRLATVDGNEYSLAVNVLAPFLLISLLLQTVRASGAGRVLVTSSISMGSADALDDLQCLARWSAHRAYSLSKLCDAMLIMELHERYGGSPQKDLSFLTMDPGTVNTKMLEAGWGRCGIPVTSATRSYELLCTKEYEGRSGEIIGAWPDREVSDHKKRAKLWDDLVRLTGAVYPPPLSS